jgi:hypothetical protein
MLRERIVGVLCALLAGSALAGDRVVLEVAGSEDSDGLRQHAELAGYLHALPEQGKKAHVGVRAGYWQLAAPGGLQEDFSVLRLDHERRLGPVDLALGVKQLASDDWSPTLGSAHATWQATPRWSLAAGIATDIVDTALAARRETRFDTVDISSDYRIGDAFTVIGGLLHQDFSDGNEREGGLLRLVYAPPRIEGFNTQLRWRRNDGDLRGIGYFSPDRFEEAMLQLQYGRALPGGRFVLTGVAGAGGQQVDRGETTSTFLAELRARGWFSDRFGLEGKGGCSNSGDIGVRAAGGSYRYCYVNLALIRSL